VLDEFKTNKIRSCDLN